MVKIREFATAPFVFLNNAYDLTALDQYAYSVRRCSRGDTSVFRHFGQFLLIGNRVVAVTVVERFDN